MVFLVFWNLLASLSRLSSVVYHLSFSPAHFIRLLTILPTIQAFVPTSSRRSFILRLSTLLTPDIFLIQLFSNTGSLCWCSSDRANVSNPPHRNPGPSPSVFCSWLELNLQFCGSTLWSCVNLNHKFSGSTLWPCRELNIQVSGSTLWICLELNLQVSGSTLWSCLKLNLQVSGSPCRPRIWAVWGQGQLALTFEDY